MTQPTSSPYSFLRYFTIRKPSTSVQSQQGDPTFQENPSSFQSQPVQGDPITFQGFITTMRSKVTADVVSHAAIVAALVGSVFLAALNGNILFLLIGGGGLVGEGYLIFKLYTQSQLAAQQQQQEQQQKLQQQQQLQQQNPLESS